jgi:hypothetical protein
VKKDMAKIIVERPRHKSRRATTDDPKGWKRRRHGRDCDLEDLPTREKMTLRYDQGEQRKELNENLNPLKRFLRKNVGRPWDKVYSEICERISPNSTVQQHILQHVWDFVEKNTYLGEDGGVWVRGMYGSSDMPIGGSWRGETLYVHPVDGLLKKAERRKWKMREPDPADKVRAEYPGNDGKQFHRINGIWYTVDVRPLPEKLSVVTRLPDTKQPMVLPTREGHLVDAILNQTLFSLTRNRSWTNPLKEKYGKRVYAVSMKQSNGKELKMAGLANDPRGNYLVRVAETMRNKQGVFEGHRLHDVLSARGVRHFTISGTPTKNGVYRVSMSQSAFDRVSILMRQGNMREVTSLTREA